jgi:Uma2 family endonuclease
MATIVQTTSTSGGPLKLASPVTVTTQLPLDWSLADLHRRLGDIPLERIRLYPPPGLATVEDVTRLQDTENRLCELIDGTLVEKPMGYYESRLAAIVITYLQLFVEKHDLGIVLGEGGTLRILANQVRVPDVCFISWSRFPNRLLPRQPVPHLSPDLAVEILSDSNTQTEMDRKRTDYFQAGTKMVWYIDPATRTATAYTVANQGTHVAEDQCLEGGEVLPGFSMSLRELFAKAGAREQ